MNNLNSHLHLSVVLDWLSIQTRANIFSSTSLGVGINYHIGFFTAYEKFVLKVLCRLISETDFGVTDKKSDAKNMCKQKNFSDTNKCGASTTTYLQSLYGCAQYGERECMYANRRLFQKYVMSWWSIFGAMKVQLSCTDHMLWG